MYTQCITHAVINVSVNMIMGLSGNIGGILHIVPVECNKKVWKVVSIKGIHHGSHGRLSYSRRKVKAFGRFNMGLGPSAISLTLTFLDEDICSIRPLHLCTASNR